MPTKLSAWGNQNQAKYFLKERTLCNRWGSNMGIPIYMLFFWCETNKIKRFKIFPRLSEKIHDISMTFSGSLEFHDISRFSKFPNRVATLRNHTHTLIPIRTYFLNFIVLIFHLYHVQYSISNISDFFRERLKFYRQKFSAEWPEKSWNFFNRGILQPRESSTLASWNIAFSIDQIRS